jgi:hypothetical protein
MRRISLLILCLAWLASLPAKHGALLAVADSLRASGDTYAAITEYKRYVSYEGEDRVSGEVFLRLALASGELGEYRDALAYVEKAFFAAATDSLRAEYTIDKAILLMNARNFSLAEFILFREARTGRYPAVRERAAFLLGLNYILQAKWYEAGPAIRDYAQLTGRQDAPETQTLLAAVDEARVARTKDPGLAKSLSSWLPGLGQFYAGDWSNGVNSLAINSAIIWWFVESALSGQYVKLVPIAWLFWKYYQGSRVRAALITEDKNRERREQLVQTATEFYGELIRQY